MALKRAVLFRWSGKRLTSESVQGPALPLEGVDDVHGCDGLPLGVLGVGDGVTDDVLKEHLQHTSGLLVDEARDSLHTTTTSQTADGRLGDTLDVITKNFSVTLSAPLSQTLSSFSSARHVSELSMRTSTRNDLPGTFGGLYKTTPRCADLVTYFQVGFWVVT